MIILSTILSLSLSKDGDECYDTWSFMRTETFGRELAYLQIISYSVRNCYE